MTLACLFRGHRWGEWERGVPITSNLTLQTTRGDVRFCKRCKARDFRA